MNFKLVIICAICFGVLCSRIARTKNRNNFYWFILGFSFGIISLIIIYFLKPLKDTNQNVINQNQSLSDNNYWYYLDINKKQIGPVSIKLLFDNYLEGKISDSTFVWNDTMKNWTKLKNVSIFNNILKRSQ